MSGSNGIFKWINLIHIGADYTIVDFGNSGLHSRSKPLKNIEGRYLIARIVDAIGQPPIYSALNWNGQQVQYLMDQNHPRHIGYEFDLHKIKFAPFKGQIQELWDHAEIDDVLNPNSL